MINTEKIHLRKQIVFNLAKNKGIENQKAQVVLCMDYSGSMTSLYRMGHVQTVLERLVPLAMQFDDNQEMEFYLFDDAAKKHGNNLSLKNLDGFINREILPKYSFGGTNYAPPIESIVRDYAQFEKTGFLGMGKKTSKTMDLPVYVIFITDGENYDHPQTERALIEASKAGIFFQFVGIGHERFHFLQRLDNLQGRFIDNANFFKFPDLTGGEDLDLYGKLLEEFPSWITLARTNNLIK